MDGKIVSKMIYFSHPGENKIVFEIPPTIPAGNFNFIMRSDSGRILVKNIVIN